MGTILIRYGGEFVDEVCLVEFFFGNLLGRVFGYEKCGFGLAFGCGFEVLTVRCKVAMDSIWLSFVEYSLYYQLLLRHFY